MVIFFLNFFSLLINMAVNKPRVTVTTSLNVIICTLIFFGIMPFSLFSYCKHKILKTSIFGNIYSIFSILHFVIEYHMETIETIAQTEGDNRESGWYYNYSIRSRSRLQT